MTEFSIRAVANGSRRDLIVAGDVDLEVVEALTRVAHFHLADTDVQCLRFDFGAVTFIDSTGLGALVGIRNEANQQGKSIELHHIPPRIRKLLVITGLSGVFAIDSREAPGAELPEAQSVADGSERDAPTDPQLRIVPS